MARAVRCPTCARPVPWEPASQWRPFCSERCRLIDLGEWITEARRIPSADSDAVPSVADDLVDPPDEHRRS